LSGVARQAALRGMAGMEWAAFIPGSVGGAVYGNAGAHGSDMNASLILAEILHPENGYQEWTVSQMSYQYRSSILKRERGQTVILAARLRLHNSTPDEVQARMAEFNKHRKQSQPPGASMGSMFKNPPGDYAGRLIEAAGLKGTRIGGAQISTIHANFFINQGSASAADIHGLVQLAKKTVHDQFNVDLELEIELLGEF
jgi:UDP-N-acetylmuramate dehydrogenase